MSYVFGFCKINNATTYFSRSAATITVESQTPTQQVSLPTYFELTYPVSSGVGAVRYYFPSNCKVVLPLGDVFRQMVANGFGGGSATFSIVTDGAGDTSHDFSLNVVIGCAPVWRALDRQLPPSRLKMFGSGNGANATDLQLSANDSGKYVIAQSLVSGEWTPAMSEQAGSLISAQGIGRVTLNFGSDKKGVMQRIIVYSINEQHILTDSEVVWQGEVEKTETDCDHRALLCWTPDVGNQKCWCFEVSEISRDTQNAVYLANGINSADYYAGAFATEVKDFVLSMSVRVRNLTDDEAAYFDDLVSSSRVVLYSIDVLLTNLIAIAGAGTPTVVVKDKSETRTISCKMRDLTFKIEIVKQCGI